MNFSSDVYGNPYSDAAKKVTVSLDQPGSGGDVKTLQLTILPDAGNAGPAVGDNPNCGAATPSGQIPISRKVRSTVTLHLRTKAKVKRGVAKVGRINCATACGHVKAIAKKGKKVVARGKANLRKSSGLLKLKLTKVGKKMLARKGKLKVSLNVWVKPPGQKAVHTHDSVKLIR